MRLRTASRNITALTLIELLLVIGIIAILVGLLLGPVGQAWSKVRHAGWVNKADAHSQRLIDQLSGYYRTHPDTRPMSSDQLLNAGAIDQVVFDFLNDKRVVFTPFSHRSPSRMEILRVDYGDDTFLSSGGVRTWKVKDVIDLTSPTSAKPPRKSSK